MPKLVINPGSEAARVLELKPGANSFGRIETNDFHIPDVSVSSRHAEITVTDNSVMVKDLGSTNGTFLNRARIEESELQHGQLLRFGGVEMLFEADNPTAVPAVAAPRLAVRAYNVPPPVPVPPPIVEEAVPPIAPAMIEPPPGRTNCKSHPKNPVQWYCEKCDKFFCPLCVNVRRTHESSGNFCRACGTQCLPVKVTYAPGSLEKKPKVYSDVTILLRCAGFGAVMLILTMILWPALGTLVGGFFTGLFCWGTGILAGVTIKLASQDRPGIVYSLMACGLCLLGSFLGLVMMIYITHHGGFGIYSLMGLLAGLFSAWRISGGDF